MALLAVNTGAAGYFPLRSRRSAGRKMDVVLGCSEERSSKSSAGELRVEGHRIAAWRDEFLDGGRDA
jgi:hypothetical protein